MKMSVVTFFFFILFSSQIVSGVTHYVSLDGGHVSPFTSWATAATNIQDAVDIAVPGEDVIVTNGVYQNGGALTPGYTSMNRVVIDKAVSLRSVNGPENTIIQGSYSSFARCIYLTNGAEVSGFTLRQGNTTTNLSANFFYEKGGGGALLDHGGLITNCLIHYNTANVGWGGGVLCYDAGMVTGCDINDNDAVNVGGVHCETGGKIINCRIFDNNAYVFTGGFMCNNGGLVDGCIVSNNTVEDAGIGGGTCSGGGVIRNSVITRHSIMRVELSSGAGLSINTGGTAEWCVITANESRDQGAGAYIRPLGVMRHCLVSGNTSREGGGVYGDELSIIENTFFCNNEGNMGGGLFLAGSAFNCTFSGNYAAWRGGGVYCADSGVMVNSLIYNNLAPEGTNIFEENPGTGITYCCSDPLIAGTGNITGTPMLAGIFNPHIGTNSSCIDAGLNISVPVMVDIDHEQRISGGTVDIGCDEMITGGMTGELSVAIIAEFINAVAAFPLTFTSDIQGKVTAFTWDVDGSDDAENATQITKSWAAPGDYSIVLSASNNDHPAGISATVVVHIVSAFTNYAAAGSAQPVPPYTSWATAAAVIQDAVDICPCGGVVLVSNGVYTSGGGFAAGTSNRVMITKPISVRAVAGAENTYLAGVDNIGPEAVRGAYVGSGASLAGFTLTNGATSKTGSANRDVNGGGVFIDRNSVLSNCVVIGNEAWYRGGGVFAGSDAVVQNCVITGNESGNGGGVYCDSVADLTVSRICNNTSYAGGGIFLNFGGRINRCIVQSNICLSAGSIPGTGGGVCSLNGSAIDNSLIVDNQVDGFGGGVFCASQNVKEFMTVNNCTIARNDATAGGGGVYCMRSLARETWATVRNSIIYDNSAPEGFNWHNDIVTTVYAYCCTTPEPYGPENITNSPGFVDIDLDNFRLLESAPCVAAGTNAYALLPYDLDGNPRIYDGTVDIGCYEFIPEPVSGVVGIVILAMLAGCLTRRRVPK
jgi:hypothetical protein